MIVLVILAGAGAAFYWAGRPSPVTVSGTMTIVGDVAGGRACTGDGGFEDLQDGTSVVVHDAAGKVIGTGRLGEGAGEQLVADTALRCRFAFRVPDVPRQRFYGIEVSHRGIVQFTAAEVDREDVELSLGP
ncbi:hypothetical protein QWU11_20875 [Actinomadura sp. DC4]|nr:hypothetical protein [Actinomadura sp. DC4]